jgi:hypothetical protein
VTEDQYINGSMTIAGSLTVTGDLRLANPTNTAPAESESCDALTEGTMRYEKGTADKPGRLLLCQNKNGKLRWIEH